MPTRKYSESTALIFLELTASDLPSTALHYLINKKISRDAYLIWNHYVDISEPRLITRIDFMNQYSLDFDASKSIIDDYKSASLIRFLKGEDGWRSMGIEFFSIEDLCCMPYEELLKIPFED